MVDKNKKSTVKYKISVEPKNYEHYFFINKKFTLPVAFNYAKFKKTRSKHVVVVRLDTHKDPKIIGVCVLSIFFSSINIDYTIVDPKYRKQGINRAVLEFIDNIAQEQNITKLTANIRETNEASLNSFTQAGFIPEEKTELYKNGDQKVFVFKKVKQKNTKHFECDCGCSDFWYFWDRVRCHECLAEYKETSFISKVINFTNPFTKTKWKRTFVPCDDSYSNWDKHTKGYKYTPPVYNNTNPIGYGANHTKKDDEEPVENERSNSKKLEEKEVEKKVEKTTVDKKVEEIDNKVIEETLDIVEDKDVVEEKSKVIEIKKTPTVSKFVQVPGDFVKVIKETNPSNFSRYFSDDDDGDDGDVYNSDVYKNLT